MRRAVAAEVLSGVRFLRGDFEGALAANRARGDSWTWGVIRDAFDDYGSTVTVLDGLSGPAAILFRPSAPGANLLRGL